MTKTRPSREDMCNALREADVDFPAHASVSQIRTLYDQLHVTEAGTPSVSEATLQTDPVEVTSSANTSVPPAATLSVATAATYALTSAITSVTTSVTDCAAAALGPVTVSASPDATLLTVADAAPSATSLPIREARNTPDVDELELELVRLRKQKEIMDLRRALSGNDDYARGSGYTSPIRFDLSAVESMVAKFSGDDTYDVNKWFNDLEDAFTVLGFDERAKLVGYRRLITGTAGALLRTVSVHDYAGLKGALLEFGRSFTLQEVFHLLKTRRLQPTESLKRYVIEMQEIASRATVPECELIDMIIEGIGDRSKNIAVLYGARSIDELKTLINRYKRLATP